MIMKNDSEFQFSFWSLEQAFLKAFCCFLKKQISTEEMGSWVTIVGINDFEDGYLKKETLISSAFSLFFVFFLWEDDEDLSEEGDEVDEEVERVVDEVSVAGFVSGDDELSVVANEAGHDANSAVQKHILHTSTEHS